MLMESYSNVKGVSGHAPDERCMNDNKLEISTKIRTKGDDGHKIFSVRIKSDMVKMIDGIASETNRSRNELINIFLEYALDNYEIKVESNA